MRLLLKIWRTYKAWRELEHYLEERMQGNDINLEGGYGDGLYYLQGFGSALAATHTKMQELRREVEGG